MIRLRKPTRRQRDGRRAEQLAIAHLSRHGLRTVQRNYHCRLGEIDLIMRDRDELVFVEVRYRRNDSHGTGLETVTAHKQRRLQQTARHYLARHPRLAQQPCRFDIVSIDGALEDHSIVWLQNAITG